MEWLNPGGVTAEVTWSTALLSCLMAFALTQAIAGIYIFTFRGLSYSRTLVQAMALGSIITCMLMLAIGNNIATALGIAGGLSIIRFRTTMRDPRDIVFVFAALSAGIASGLRAYAPAVVGTGIFIGAALVLHLVSFGTRQQLDGLIRFITPAEGDASALASAALKERCRMFTLVTLREVGQGREMEHAYQVAIPNPENRSRLVADLNRIEGVHDVALMLQEPTLEL